MNAQGTHSVYTQAEREGQAIRRLCMIRPHNTGNHAGILWNTNTMRKCVRDSLEETAFARVFVKSLRQADWFKGVRISAFLKQYCNVTSSSKRSKGNARRQAKRA